LRPTSFPRASEFVGRFGGGEFVLIAPVVEADDLGSAGERLRQAVDEMGVQLPNGRTST
jgi:GGDEF domain-containing protein